MGIIRAVGTGLAARALACERHCGNPDACNNTNTVILIMREAFSAVEADQYSNLEWKLFIRSSLFMLLSHEREQKGQRSTGENDQETMTSSMYMLFPK